MVGVVNVIVPLVAGAGAGIGLLVAVAGARGRRLVSRPVPGRSFVRIDRVLQRVLLAAASGLLIAVLTHWPVATLVAAAAGFAAPSATQAGGRHRRELARIEAIAGWVEQVRDTLSAANGLEHALVASARVAPSAIAPEVERLAARSGYEPLPSSLRRFADEVDHPLADFVVAALVVAAEQEARELGALLGQLAETARDEARLRNRVWVGRARNRTVVRVIGGVIVVAVGLLLVFDREYLRPYDTAGGQVALATIALVFVAALSGMERLGRIELPDRFIGATMGEERAR